MVSLYRLDERPKRVEVADGEVISRASDGHGRGRGSVPGVIALVTVVLTPRTVVKYSGECHASVLVVVDRGRRARRLVVERRPLGMSRSFLSL